MEERLKSPQADTLEARLTQDIQNRLVKHLWGGHSDAALIELEKLFMADDLNKDIRFLAAWQSARWYFFVDNFSKALEIADLISSLGESYKKQRLTVMIYSFCFMAQGKNQAAHSVLEAFLSENPNDSDMRLAFSNTQDNDELRLAQINRVYHQHHLAAIELIDKSRPLSLGNITASAPKVNSPFKVTVIIPTFNSADKLGIAIDSLLVQSWDNLEIIVVDDCSTDETFLIAQQYSQKDKRVIALRQEKNGGAYLARNSGLAIATGDFITTHDGDDWSHPQKIEKQMEFLAQNQKVMGVCTFWIRAKNSLHFTQNWRLNPYLTHWSHSSFLFRRQVIEDIGFWDNVVVGGDTEYIWRVEAKYGSWAVKNIMGTVPMAIALDDEASLTRSKATHVKTIHYGLRHIYRSAARHWHSNTTQLRMGNERKQHFNAPLSMRTRNAPSIKLDKILIGDFSCPAQCERALNIFQLSDSGEIALLHWATFDNKEEELNNIYFELIQHNNVQPLVYGQTATCQNLIVLNAKVLEKIPEQLPEITTPNGLIYCEDNNISFDLREIFNSHFGVYPKVQSINNIQEIK